MQTMALLVIRIITMKDNIIHFALSERDTTPGHFAVFIWRKIV